MFNCLKNRINKFLFAQSNSSFSKFRIALSTYNVFKLIIMRAINAKFPSISAS